jgi:dihydrolipoamide dehydrogenase
VGKTESRARAEGRALRTAECDFDAVAGAGLQAVGDRGRAKIVVDEPRRTLIGATFVGPGVVDHLHAATIAVTAAVPLERLWHAVPAFPTTSEIWLRLLEAYGL